ncbi:MAG: D-alanyl-D-alanine carboxypeptidase [Erysipelotrichaceae bacterium]|nr:D-alanyl-D-alanine carboxypeptidase [Erysipelotrichaceae bacterium]
MKKILILLMILFCNIISLFKYSKVSAEETLSLNGDKSLVMEVTTGRILYASNEHSKAYPASMTKMMGMYLVLEAINNNKLSFEDMVTCSSFASSMGGTQIFLEEGEQMSVNDLFKAVAINSANDAIVCLGEHLFGSNEAFVDKMNKKAKELKMENTNFVNATGFDDENHYTTPYDMGIIARRLVLDYQEVLEYSSLTEDYIKGNRNEEFWLVNTNKLLKHCDGMDGLKTGYTSKAGYNLASTVKRNGIRVISVVMNEKSIQERSQDTIKLVNYAFSKLKVDRLFSKDDILSKYIFENSMGKEVDLYLNENVDIVHLENEDIKDFNYRIELLDNKLPLKENDIVGKLVVEISENCYLHYDLIIKEKVEKMNLFKLWINNIIKSIV